MALIIRKLIPCLFIKYRHLSEFNIFEALLVCNYLKY